MDNPDKAGGVHIVGYDMSASFEGVEDTQEALVVETADTEALKPHSLPKATNIKWHTSHLLTQEPSQVDGIDPDSPEPSPMPMDYLVTLPIDQPPASIVAHTITYDMPYYEAVYIPFMATSRPMHSDSIKWIPLTFSNTSDPPSIYAKANSPVEGSANVNGSTAEDWCTTSEHMSFIDYSILPQLLQQQETALSSTTECNHIVAAYGDTEAL
jgi:hypothetical protein